MAVFARLGISIMDASALYLGGSKKVAYEMYFITFSCTTEPKLKALSVS